jgi:hypothetical protein
MTSVLLAEDDLFGLEGLAAGAARYISKGHDDAA